MCGSRLDVVLCSFAFERVHRRVPLCRSHRQPLLEIDHYTRPDAAAVEDVPPVWLSDAAMSDPALNRVQRRLPAPPTAPAAGRRGSRPARCC